MLRLRRLNPNKHTPRDLQAAVAEAACRGGGRDRLGSFYLVDADGAVLGLWVDRLSGRPLTGPKSDARCRARIGGPGTTLADDQPTLAECGLKTGARVCQQLANRR